MLVICSLSAIMVFITRSAVSARASCAAAISSGVLSASAKRPKISSRIAAKSIGPPENTSSLLNILEKTWLRLFTIRLAARICSVVSGS